MSTIESAIFLLTEDLAEELLYGKDRDKTKTNIKDAINNGEVTIDEIIEVFREALIRELSE